MGIDSAGKNSKAPTVHGDLEAIRKGLQSLVPMLVSPQSLVPILVIPLVFGSNSCESPWTCIAHWFQSLLSPQSLVPKLVSPQVLVRVLATIRAVPNVGSLRHCPLTSKSAWQTFPPLQLALLQIESMTAGDQLVCYLASKDLHLVLLASQCIKVSSPVQCSAVQRY